MTCLVCGDPGGRSLGDLETKRLAEIANVLGGLLKGDPRKCYAVHHNCYMRALAWAHWKKAKLEKTDGEK